MADLKSEQEIQSQWHVKERFKRLSIIPKMVVNEFLESVERNRIQNKQLQQLIRYVSICVPHYRELFADLKISPDSIKCTEDLPLIPILDKETLAESGKRLISKNQPKINRAQYETKTSGSTGKPTVVVQSVVVGLMFALCKQREFRWLKADPMKTFGTIINSNNVSLPGIAGKIKLGQDVKLDHWRYVENIFQTGKSSIFLNENTVADQIHWLQETDPFYFSCSSQDLENLAMAYGRKEVPKNMKWIQATTQDFNSDMRRVVESVFNVPTHQNYGLNEIGMVASRCHIGKKYHVNWEHCIVEIVDEDGFPVPPGERGRIIITSLSNWAMPLVRYDTGDIGEAAVDDCACGRNMPSFANIHGRYRRLAYLPETTTETRSMLRNILQNQPESTKQYFSRIQLHQDIDLNYTLTFETHSKLPTQMTSDIQEQWRQGVSNRGLDHSLSIRETDRIEYPKGGKYQNFTSDFIPSPNNDFADE